MAYGLTAAALTAIQHIFAASPGVDRAILFGSRAKGNFKPGSDIDIALLGKALNFNALLPIYQQLEDLELPNTFDLVIYNHIEEPNLVEHINRVGVSLFSRK